MKALLTLFLFLCSAVNADVIYLKNGDRITGEITLIWDEEVTIEPSYSDKFSIELDDIQSIETDLPFDIELYDGREGEYRFMGVDDAGNVILNSDLSEIVVGFSDLKRVDEVEEYFEWESKVDINQSFSRGNTNSQSTNLNANLELKFGDRRWQFDHNTVYEEVEGERVKESDRLNASYNWIFNDPWFVALNVTVERNPVALLDDRVSINPALGYDIWDDPNRTLNFQLGVGYQTETIDGDNEVSTLIDWRARYAHDYFNGDLEIFHNHQIYQNLEGRENLVFNSVTGIRYELTDDLYINIQINYDVDSAPAEGTKGEDLTLLFGAGLEF